MANETGDSQETRIAQGPVVDPPPASSEAEASTPFKEWRDSVLKLPREIKTYWRDRKTILANNRAVTTPGQLKSKPFTFALNGLVLPGIVIGLLYSAASGLYSFPPPQIDRAIDEQKTIQKILDDALHNDSLKPKGESEPAWARGVSTEALVNESKRIAERLRQLNAEKSSPPGLRDDERAELEQLERRTKELVPVYVNRSMRDVHVTGVAALKESVNNQLKLLRWKKFVEVMNSWRSAIIGVTLVIAAYLFGSLIRRMKPTAEFSTQAVNAYLFCMGAVLLVPNLIGAILGVALDLAIRYDVDWFLNVYPFVMLGLAAWVIFIVWRAGVTLSQALDGQPTNVKHQRKVIRRLFASQIVAGVIVQVVVTAAALPVLWAISRLQK